MSEEKSVLWLCSRCADKKEIETEPDPVLLKVCDGCSIENWTRSAKAVKGTQAISEEINTTADSSEEPSVEVEVPPEEMKEIPLPPLEVTVEPEPSKLLDKMTKAELLKELESRG